jgi:hypothetical protein
MISAGCPSSVNPRPRMRGSAPKRCRQYPCVIITRSGPPGATSSLVNPRPSSGWIRSSGRNASVTIRAGTRSGSSPPVTVTCRPTQAARSSNTRFSSR